MSSHLFISVAVYVISLITSLLLLPVVRKISVRYRCYAFPNHRSSHRYEIPNIGGIVFYASILIALAFLYERFKWDHIAVLSIISFGLFLGVGLIDDIGNIKPWQKFLMQILGVVCFLLGYDIVVTNFFGLLQLGDRTAFLYTVFLFLLMINALNMMDGIDGLAAMLALSIYLVTGIIFFVNRIPGYGIFCITMTGILTGFLWFNFSKERKILMGDTGSLWLGFTLFILLLKLYAGIEEGSLMVWGKQDSCFWIFSAMILPALDLVRVAVFRIFNGVSPFCADRNHIHHILVDRMKFSHMKAAIILVLLNLALFLLSGLAAYVLPSRFLWLYFIFLFIVYSSTVSLLTHPRLMAKFKRYFPSTSQPTKEA